MDKKSWLGIVIVNYNGVEWTTQCLHSLRRQTLTSFSIVVVDNGSTDRSAQIIRESFPEARVLESDTNLGYCRANNRGIEVLLSEGVDCILLLNNDTVVEEGCLSALVLALDSQPASVGSLQPKLRALESPRRLDSAGQLVSVIGMVVERGRGERDEGQYDSDRVIFAAKGAAALVRAEVFRRVGLLDDTFFLTYDDIDFSFRMRGAGFVARYCPNAIVYHSVGSPASRAFRSLNVYEAYKNQLRLLLKNYRSPIRAALCCLLALSVMLARAFRSLTLGNPKHLMAVARAAEWNVRFLGDTLAHRARQQEWRVVSDRLVLSEGIVPIWVGVRALWHGAVTH